MNYEELLNKYEELLNAGAYMAKQDNRLSLFNKDGELEADGRTFVELIRHLKSYHKIGLKECCCNCKYQLNLMKHPTNSGFGEGSIMEQCGYVCTNPFDDKSNAGNAIFSDRKHGSCELHEEN